MSKYTKLNFLLFIFLIGFISPSLAITTNSDTTMLRVGVAGSPPFNFKGEKTVE